MRDGGLYIQGGWRVRHHLGLVFHGGSDVAGCFLAVLDKRFESLLHLLLSRVEERDRAGVSVGCVG